MNTLTKLDMGVAADRWKALRKEILAKIEVIDRNTPWQEVEPGWWLEMSEVRGVLLQRKQEGFKTETGRAYIKNGMWVVELPTNEVLTVLDQIPYHSVLAVGRDENEEVVFEVLEGVGGRAAKVLCFVRLK